MKYLFYSFIIFIFIALASCKFDTAEPEYLPYEHKFEYPYQKSSFDVSTNIGIAYKGGIGTIKHNNYIGGNSCVTNTFFLSIPLDNKPNMIYNVYPQIVKRSILTQVPFAVGKYDVIPTFFGTRDCTKSSQPEALLTWTIIEGKPVDSIAEVSFVSYLLDDSKNNYIEITKADTLNHDIRGNFNLTYVKKYINKTNPDPQFPDTVKVVCSYFNIEWGKK